MQPNEIEMVESTLRNLQSGNNAIRVPAEKTITAAFENNTHSIVNALMQVCHSSQHFDLRNMALILLRRYLMTGDMDYNKLQPSTKFSLKALLLKIFENEQQEQVRRGVVAMVSQIAEVELLKNEWPELLPAAQSFCKSPNDVVRADAFFLFGSISCADEYNEQQKRVFTEIFVTGLRDHSIAVRKKSFDAMVSFSEKLNPDGDHSALICAVQKFVQDAVDSNNEATVVDMLEGLIDFVTISPKLIKRDFEKFVGAMSTLAMNRNMASSTRVLAMEFLVILAEEDNGLYRRSANFVQKSFMAALSLMVELEDDPDWINNLDDEPEEDEMYTDGEFAIDRLAQSFGSERVIKVAMPLILEFLKNPNWKQRVVGLIAISQMAESVDTKHIADFVRVVVPHFNDKHPRVRFSAIHCIGQMCDDFAPEIQNEFHSIILPSLVDILKGSSVVKVQAHAGAAIVNFVENVSSKTIAPYLQQLLQILFQLLPNTARTVQEQIVTIVASVSSATTHNLHSDLEKFVPILMNNFSSCNKMDEAMLKSKSLEALTFIGTELKGKKFYPHAHLLMKATIGTLEESKKLSTDYLDFVLQSWIRLGKILKTEFAPYLPSVMREIEQITTEEDILHSGAMGNTESDDDESYNPNSGGTNEYESALCAISTLPTEVGFAFYPFVSGCVNVLNDSIDYWAEENIRAYAASGYPALFSVVVLALREKKISPNDVLECLNNFIDRLLTSYPDEMDYSVKKAILNSIIKLLKHNHEISNAFLSTGNKSKDLLETVFDLINNSKKKMLKIARKTKEKDIDDIQINRLQTVSEMETSTIFKVTEIAGTIFQIRGDSIIPIFDSFLKNMLTLLSNKDADLFSKKAIILIVDDAINYIPAALGNYSDFLIHLFINFLEYDDLDIKQSSIYGLGLLAEKFPEVFMKKAQVVMEICLKLHSGLAGQKSDSHQALRDNAVSTFGRIIFTPAMQNETVKFFPQFLSMLPLTVDVNEIKFCDSLLIRILKSEERKFLGENFENLHLILNILGKNFEEIGFDMEQKTFLREFFGKLEGLPQNLKEQVASKLNDDAKGLAGAIKNL